MKYQYLAVISFALILGGCAGAKQFNVRNDSMPMQGSRGMSTYSDYGNDIEYNNEEELYQLNVYTGGRGGCDDGALAYAKPKLDSYMKANGFSSYTVVKGKQVVFPLSRCELYIQFEKK